MSKIASITIIAAVLIVVGAVMSVRQRNAGTVVPDELSQTGGVSDAHSGETGPKTDKSLPRLLDLGAGKCIPCKMMVPVLEGLKKDYAGRLVVEVIDISQTPEPARQYNVRLIPTQIFFDASGKEVFRHEGFFSRDEILARWKELGVDLAGTPAAAIERTAPAVADARSRESICFMCDGDANPKTRVLVKGQEEQVILCSPHCFFIYCSSLKEPAKAEAIATVTDAASGDLIPAATATYLYGLDGKGRPTIMAFADRETATKAQQKSAGNLLNLEGLRNKELATRCGFCDRAVYPEDACSVKVAGSTRTYGCCVMCGLGVAARLRKDIEVEAKDALSGETIRVQTLNGSVASLEPRTAVAWAGGKKEPGGGWVSTGCFKQAFFVNEANLKAWLDKHRTATGHMVTIDQALAAKMKLTPEQIAKACKIGECK